MPNFPKKLGDKLNNRLEHNALRSLPAQNDLVDFSSNDYLGFSSQKAIRKLAAKILKPNQFKNGATGSRLLSGNHSFCEKLESFLATFYGQEEALLFNSGYDANIGFFSSVPQRGDIIFYDELVHASIRDGIKMGNAKAYKFNHNNLLSLAERIEHVTESLSNGSQDKSFQANMYVVTESVFSMDGDSPDLKELVTFCAEKNVHLIVDEAHAVGVFEKGLLNTLGLQNQVFAQIITFGKAMGCHGAAILGSRELKTYLINFARSFIYTSAMSPHSVATVLAAYQYLSAKEGLKMVDQLRTNINYFKDHIVEFGLQGLFLSSDSAIQIAIVKGNHEVKQLSQELNKNGFDVRPILSPTVTEGNERLRICLHAVNTESEMHKLLSILKEIHG